MYEFSLQSGSFSPKDWVIVTHCYQPVINTQGGGLGVSPFPRLNKKVLVVTRVWE